METSHSGLVRLPAKEVGAFAPRGFKSHRLRSDPAVPLEWRGFSLLWCWKFQRVNVRQCVPIAAKVQQDRPKIATALFGAWAGCVGSVEAYMLKGRKYYRSAGDPGGRVNNLVSQAHNHAHSLSVLLHEV